MLRIVWKVTQCFFVDMLSLDINYKTQVKFYQMFKINAFSHTLFKIWLALAHVFNRAANYVWVTRAVSAISSCITKQLRIKLVVKTTALHQACFTSISKLKLFHEIVMSMSHWRLDLKARLWENLFPSLLLAWSRSQVFPGHFRKYHSFSSQAVHWAHSSLVLPSG